MAIDSLEAIPADGTTQWIRVRGTGASNPVLVLIQQGPGLPMINEARRFRHLLKLEQAFTVIYWDQHGGGRSLRTPKDRADISLQQMMGDTVSLQHPGCGAGHHGRGHGDRPARGAAAARRKLPAATVTGPAATHAQSQADDRPLADRRSQWITRPGHVSRCWPFSSLSRRCCI
jgi:pimeloyl-ACP methyl ester carboxylesterase